MLIQSCPPCPRIRAFISSALWVANACVFLRPSQVKVEAEVIVPLVSVIAGLAVSRVGRTDEASFSLPRNRDTVGVIARWNGIDKPIVAPVGSHTVANHLDIGSFGGRRLDGIGGHVNSEFAAVRIEEMNHGRAEKLLASRHLKHAVPKGGALVFDVRNYKFA